MIYDILRNISKHDNFTISQAEKDLGIAKGSLCKLDAHKASNERLERIAAYFNVPVSLLTKRTVPATMTLGDVMLLAERTGISANELMETDVDLREYPLNALVMDVLLERTPIMKAHKEAQKERVEKYASMLLKKADFLFNSLTEEQQKQIIDYMEFLKFKG